MIDAVRKLGVYLGAMLSLAVCLTNPVAAQPASTSKLSHEKIEAKTQAIGETMMSPFCPGRTISACPSPQARELRNQISAWLSSGKTEEEIRWTIQTTYGKEVRGTPEDSGFGLLGWWGPAIFVMIALLFVGWSLRRMHFAKLRVQSASEKNDKKSKAEIRPDSKLVEQIEAQVKGRLF